MLKESPADVSVSFIFLLITYELYRQRVNNTHIQVLLTLCQAADFIVFYNVVIPTASS